MNLWPIRVHFRNTCNLDIVFCSVVWAFLARFRLRFPSNFAVPLIPASPALRKLVANPSRQFAPKQREGKAKERRGQRRQRRRRPRCEVTHSNKSHFIKMVQRVAIRSRKSYNTKSNRRRIIKTPCELLARSIAGCCAAACWRVVAVGRERSRQR